MEGLDFVVLIDDDEINNFICGNIILKSGFAKNLKAFTNPEEAFRFLMQSENGTDSPPEMIFLDINMPVIDGWTFLEKIELEGTGKLKSLPVIMLSSSIYKDDVEKSRTYNNVINFISKPINKEALASSLAKIKT